VERWAGHPRWPRGRSADQLVGAGGCLPRKRGGTPSSGTCGSWWSASWGCTPPPANSLARGSFSPYPPARQDVAPQVHCSRVLGFGWYQERAMGQRKGKGVRGQAGEEG
jgi:hypothetical protein